ncbi:ATP-dependent serine protease [bacterium]|nr:ATP-dependent serine protease [bacterium]
MKKALTLANIQNQVIKKILFTGIWLDAFGNPQNRGLWFIWGGSGSGKSTFLMMLAKVLAALDYKVLYNLLEEESDDLDYIERTQLIGMQEVKDHFLTASYDLNDLDTYLSSRNSPQVVVIDSLPYLTKSFDEWMVFKRKWSKKKILIVSGHAKGKNPSTEMQERVMFDAKMKIFVTAYLAICKGRTIGKNGGRFIIWKEGYEKLRGQQN